jgi:phosphinothricin acetyltransferase
MNLRPATPADASALARIYNHYVRESIATFEIKEIPDRVMTERLLRVLNELPWLVAESDQGIRGYAYANWWKGRPAYRNSVETTIYLDPHEIGQGLGVQLYSDLIERLSLAGLHTAIGGIALPNQASISLHEKLGFQKVAHFRQVGHKFDRWIDVGYWQLLLS